MIVKFDTFQRDFLGIIALILLDFTLIHGGFAHFHQDTPHQLPFLVQGVGADRICHMRGNAGLGVEHQHVMRRPRSLQVNQLPSGRFKEFGGQVGVIYKVEELIVTSQEAQYRKLTSLIIGPLSEYGEQVTGPPKGVLQGVQVMSIVNQSLLIFNVFILRKI
jgi:hypothetical protein